MILHIIFGQRVCRYEGEYAPEALDIADEFTMDENPEWLASKLAAHKANTDFDSVEVVLVKIPDSAITDALYPKPITVEGQVY